MTRAVLNGIECVCLAAWACTYPAPDRRGFDEAMRLAQQVDAGQLMPTVQELYAGHLDDPKVSCDGFSPEVMFPACQLSRDSAIQLVTERLAGYGYDTGVVSMPGEPLAAFNVVAERRGTSMPNEVVLVGAHLDAFYGGADDNCSGVAAMLEIARVFSTHPTPRTLRFVGFDLEEYGLRGSERYVESGAARDVQMAVILETVGYASEAPGSQTAVPGLPTGSNAEVGDFIAAVGNEQSADMIQRLTALNHEAHFVRLKSLLGSGDGAYPVTGQMMRSDHAPFWTHDIPALMLCDSANYRNANYHEPTDTPETLNAPFLAGVTRLGTAIVSLAAGATREGD